MLSLLLRLGLVGFGGEICMSVCCNVRNGGGGPALIDGDLCIVCSERKLMDEAECLLLPLLLRCNRFGRPGREKEGRFRTPVAVKEDDDAEERTSGPPRFKMDEKRRSVSAPLLSWAGVRGSELLLPLCLIRLRPL